MNRINSAINSAIRSAATLRAARNPHIRWHGSRGCGAAGGQMNTIDETIKWHRTDVDAPPKYVILLGIFGNPDGIRWTAACRMSDSDWTEFDICVGSRSWMPADQPKFWAEWPDGPPENK